MKLLSRAGGRIAWLAFALAGALAVPSPAAAANYPAPVADFERYDAFPQVSEGYARGQVTAFAPAMADFAIGYDNLAFPNAITLFFYPHQHDTLAAQLADEEGQVLRAHRGARVTDRRTVTLTHGAATREATLVTFAFDGEFAGRQQALASQLLLVFRDKGIFMVRSTTPEANGADAERTMLSLVQHIDWESVPGR